MSGFDLSNFLASFFDEARERLSSINQALVLFESDALDAEGLVTLRRDAHTIKGSALMLGVNDVGEIAHLFEDMVETLIEHSEWQKPVATQFLYDLHDLLEKRLQNVSSDALIDGKAAKTKYHEVLEQLKAEEPTRPTDTKPDPASTLAKEVKALEEASFAITEEAEQAKPTEGFDLIIAEDDDAMNLANINVELEDFVAGSDKKEAKEAKGSSPEASIEASTEDNTDYRPIQKGSKKGSGERKNSGRFLRVDAERLEGLSHHIIEMSTEQSRHSKSEGELKKLQFNLRTLHREWKQVRHVLEGHSETSKSLAVIDSLMGTQARNMQKLVDEARFQVEHNKLTLKELRDQVLSLMLRPLDSIFSTFPRAVRDVAVKAGKRVHLVVDGKLVEMDQGVAESLVEPLVHLLNNAVAHGIEREDEREELGKPKVGQVTIVARQSGNEVRIEVMDDGRGIDPIFIKKMAVERGVTTQDEADSMDSAEILELIFRPGFSTLKEVDELAGRGIGMNIVQDAIRKLTGSIRIYSEVGKGTRFVVSVPISIAVQQALMFKIGGQQYGMLTHMVEQAVVYNKEEVFQGAAGKQFLPYRNHQVPIVDLRPMMNHKGDALSDNPYIIIAEHIEGFVGILVDELLGDGEIVVRDLDPYIKRYQPQGLMGNTIVEDGSVVMLLEPYGIKEMGRTAPNQALSIQVEEKDKLRFKVLLIDDSLIAREVEKSIFESLGFVVETAIDGMDGLEKLASSDYDMIVTDLEMPRLDGFGLVRQVRNQSQYEDMPMMVISTRESSEDRMRALEAGADSYLVKQHLNAENIVSTVKALVGPLMVKERGIESNTDLSKPS